MKKVLAYPASKPRSQQYVWAAWAYVLVLVVLICAQLVSFEKFIPLVDGYQFPGGYGTATLVTGLIVVTEVFALPFLLRMRLSHYMRWFSLGCSVLVPIIWIKISMYALLFSWVENGGLLGVYVPVGLIVQSTVALLLLGLSAIVAYGLWPKR